MNYTFAQPDQLINFIFNATDSTESTNVKNVFLDWEVISVYIEISNGLKLRMDTKIIDPSGEKDYITWRKIKELIDAFIKNNSSVGIVFDIRLRVPKDIKLQLDTNSEYKSFQASFYCKKEVNMVSITSLENKIDASYKPKELWMDYISNLINVWKIINGIA